MAEKKKVLIIDDDADFIAATRQVIESKNFSVVTAYTGDEGLEKYNSEKPDFVLCDMMIEGTETGVRVGTEIRKNDRETPVYLVSTMGDSISRYRKLDLLGFNGVLQKPIDPDLLIETIASVV
ncbi:MAG TPA: response regulator [Spirochaetota bacterium]|nr:response regulator [Spirochaetota bacterium]